MYFDVNGLLDPITLEGLIIRFINIFFMKLYLSWYKFWFIAFRVLSGLSPNYMLKTMFQGYSRRACYLKNMSFSLSEGFRLHFAKSS